MNKIILVTGASRGIGRDIAITLAKEGNRVIANYCHSVEQAKELEKQDSSITIMQADVSKQEEVEKMIEQIYTQFGRIDVLINNAGISQEKLFTEITQEDWQKMMETNLNSVFYTSQAVARIMIRQQQGLILNISSIWGEEGASCEVHYATAKAGIIGMTKALAKELGPSHIRVNAIAPGIIQTQMNAGLSPQEISDIQEQIPLGTIGQPQDITRCVQWLIQDQYTTGQVISINGGWYM